MAEWGFSTVGLAKAIVLLDEMKDGIPLIAENEWTITIGQGPEAVHYHLYVELGTSINEPQEYIRPAIRKGQRKWPEIVAKASAKADNPGETPELAVEMLFKFMFKEMKDNVPVDSGALKRSIRLYKDGPGNGEVKTVSSLV